MRGRGKKRMRKARKELLFRHTFFRSRPFDFWEGWGVWVIWFGYEFFFSNLWRYNFFFYLQIYNGVRIFPVLYGMNFSPAGQFFSWNHRSPYPRRKSQLCRSSPKLERGRLCLYFVLSSFLHMFQLAGRLPGKKKIIALPCFFFFFSARYVFLVIQYFYTSTVPWGKFFRQYFAPAFLPLCFFAKLWHFAIVAV